MVDTHCHLGLCEPPDAELVAEAARVGVRRMLTVGIDEAASEEAIAAAEAHEAVFAAVGRHPNGTTGFDDAAAARIEELAATPAGGCRGRDRARLLPRHAPARRPAPRLPRADRDRPAGREAAGDPRARRRARRPTARRSRRRSRCCGPEATGVTVILHCFSAPATRATEAAEWGWYCSFAGNVTYPKSDVLREAAAEVPDDLLLVETDSPFLSPQPVRGQAQPARQRGRHRRGAGRGARRLLSRARGDGRGERGPSCSDGEARPELPRRHEPAERDRARGGSVAATTWCSRSAAARGR